jgi:hypothetical protein
MESIIVHSHGVTKLSVQDNRFAIVILLKNCTLDMVQINLSGRRRIPIWRTNVVAVEDARLGGHLVLKYTFMSRSASVVKQIGTIFLGESALALGIALSGLVETFPYNFVGGRCIVGRLENADITRLTSKVKLSLL